MYESISTWRRRCPFCERDNLLVLQGVSPHQRVLCSLCGLLLGTVQSLTRDSELPVPSVPQQTSEHSQKSHATPSTEYVGGARGMRHNAGRVMRRFRVELIGDGGDVVEEREVRAATPEEAATDLTGEPLCRYTRGPRKTLRIKVYYEQLGAMTLLRFYSKQPASVSHAVSRTASPAPN